MMPGIDPRKMQAMMRQMGIKQEEIEAKRVIIECSDKRVVIENPNVQEIVMQGQKTWQIGGEAHDESVGLSDEDVKMVAEKTGRSEDEARKALEGTDGDIAAAIVSLVK
jgi:nascent polypeptide-associated complex subunit alpha